MGSIMDKLNDMEREEQERKNRVAERLKAEIHQIHHFKETEIQPRDYVFTQLYIAALNGISANPEAVHLSNEEVVEEAYKVAKLAYERMKK